VQDEPIGHQDVETGNEEIVNRLVAGLTTRELNAILCESVDYRLHENEDREVLDAPAIATTVPEENSAQILELR